MRSPVTQAVPLRDRRHTAPSWRRLSVNDDHLATGLVGLHDAMSLTYLVESKILAGFTSSRPAAASAAIC
jgi:hypothetical protein